MGDGWVVDLVQGTGALAVFGVAFLLARRRFRGPDTGDANDNGLD